MLFAPFFLSLLTLSSLSLSVSSSSSSSPSPSSPSASVDDTFPELTKFVFGSCSKSHMPQPLWKPIIAEKPDVFVWLGDIVYADNRVIPGWFEPASPADILNQYQMQMGRAEYNNLLKKTNVTVLGTWDDHDYGWNNAGREFQDRDASQQLLLDFLQESATSNRRKRRGIYASYLFKNPKRSDRTVKLILLDTRYHRGESDVDGGDGDLLGAEQWSWLEGQLVDSVKNNVKVTIIGSSIQVLSNLRAGVESWSSFTLSKRRLLTMIRDTGVQGLVLLSGDVHFGEILKLPPYQSLATVERSVSDGGSLAKRICLKYPLYEITSSGMTHSIGSVMSSWLAPMILPSKLSIMNPFIELNYASIDFEWGKEPEEDSFMIVAIKDVHGNSIMDQVISIKSLTAATGTTCTATISDFSIGCENFVIRYLVSHWSFSLLGLITMLLLKWCCFPHKHSSNATHFSSHSSSSQIPSSSSSTTTSTMASPSKQKAT